MKTFKLLLALLLFFTLLGCEKKENQGPHKVHYDRDMCSECKMVISDRNYAAQIVDTQKNKAYNFDDIGCAFIWMKENKPSWIESAKIYVADAESGKFINATDAFWTSGHTTPMDFGYAAHKILPKVKIYQYTEVRENILNSLKNKTTQRAMKCGGDMKCGAGKCGGSRE